MYVNKQGHNSHDVWVPLPLPPPLPLPLPLLYVVLLSFASTHEVMLLYLLDS